MLADPEMSRRPSGPRMAGTGLDLVIKRVLHALSSIPLVYSTSQQTLGSGRLTSRIAPPHWFSARPS